MATHLQESWALRSLLLGSAAFIFALPVQADEGPSIEERLDSLKQEVETLKREREAESRPAPANAVIGGDFPGSFKLPGTDTSIAIGGYVKGDVIGDIDEDLGDTFAVGALSPDEGPGAGSKTGSTRLHARESRLNFDIRTPTRYGMARAFIEGDFFGGGGNEVFSNSTSFRIRHAFGEFDAAGTRVLVGQNWTLFMPLTSYPETVDFHGPQGIPFVRQGQLRVTQDLGQFMPGLQVAGSIENAELWAQSYRGEGFFDPDDPMVGVGSRSQGDLRFGIDKLPDFVGALQYDRDGWHFKLSGLLRVLSVDDFTLADGSTADDDEVGWGVMAAASIPIVPTTTLNANFTYGDGVGRYILGVFDRQDAFLDEGGNLNSIEAWGLAASLRHQWTEQFHSNVVYGRHEIDDTFFLDATDKTQSFHVNTWFTPAEQVRFGLEYMHGRRDFVDGSLDNTANRIQFAGQYFF